MLEYERRFMYILDLLRDLDIVGLRAIKDNIDIIIKDKEEEENDKN